MRDRISLSADDFIGAGTDRKCYRHPSRPEYCIKILRPERHPRRFRREIRYYRRLKFRRIGWHRLAGYRGMIDTNLGRGAVFDLVLDEDGQVSRSLKDYLVLDDPEFNTWASDDLNSLIRYLYEQWIVFHDLNPDNILVQRLDVAGKRLVVIDGIGHNHFLSVANYSPGFARKKIVRVWNRRYPRWYSAYPAFMAALQPYPEEPGKIRVSAP